MRTLILYILVVCLVPTGLFAQSEDTLTIGAKNFTEQEILAEMAAQLIEQYTNLEVVRKFGLGGTGLCHAALVSGELDLYIEYTGTAMLDILNKQETNDPDEVFRVVSNDYRQRFDLIWLPPIGFNNTYTITVRGDQAVKHGWKKISDMAGQSSKLSAGFTSEFMVRPDGYPGLKEIYGIDFNNMVDIDPGLMYKAVADGQVDVICGFSTDGRIVAYGLQVLHDDIAFFPPYDAAPVIRDDVLQTHPEIREALIPLAGTISDKVMQQLNYAVDELRKSPAEVAREWIESRSTRTTPSFWQMNDEEAANSVGLIAFVSQERELLIVKTIEHLKLTALAIIIAILLGVPAGVAINRYPSASSTVLALAEIVQTVPSLAMLAFLFAIYGLLGLLPAVTALILYALLPIILNTYTGLKEVSPELIEAADSLGMSGRQRLFMVELPLAMPVMIAGIRTATVWTVGIATLSTFIGAGGLGDLISRGLARNDAWLTLLGAVPAALMAVVLSLVIRLVERKIRT